MLTKRFLDRGLQVVNLRNRVSANVPIVLRTTTGQSSVHHRIYHQLYGVNWSRGVSKKLKSTMHWAVLGGRAECKRRRGGGRECLIQFPTDFFETGNHSAKDVEIV